MGYAARPAVSYTAPVVSNVAPAVVSTYNKLPYTGYAGIYSGSYSGILGYNRHIVSKREADSDAEAYTPAQVAFGHTNGGVITGVDYGNGVVFRIWSYWKPCCHLCCYSRCFLCCSSRCYLRRSSRCLLHYSSCLQRCPRCCFYLQQCCPRRCLQRCPRCCFHLQQASLHQLRWPPPWILWNPWIQQAHCGQEGS